MIIEGVYKRTIQGSIKQVSDYVLSEDCFGWRIQSQNIKRKWPFFWREEWTVVLVKDIIVDDKYIIETPLTELK